LTITLTYGRMVFVMTEKRFNTNSDDYGASTSANTRGGYSDTHNKLAIQMYQLPESIIETLRRNGPSILEGDYSRGLSHTESITGAEPAVADSESVAEPVVASVAEPAKVTPAVVAKRTAKSGSVAVLDAEPVAPATVATPDTTQERASLLPYLVPYSVKRSLAKVSFNRIDSTSRKKLTEVRSTEPTVEPASVADIEKDAVVNVDGEQSVERARLIEFRIVKALGEQATHRKRGIKETLKSIWNQERKMPKMAFALGAASVALVFGGDKVLAMQENTDGHRIMHTASSEIHNTVVSKPIRSTVIGGNGEVSADPRYYDGRGYMPGNRDGNIVYSADMGIGNGRDSDTSIEEGSAKLVDQYYANKGRGEHTHITAYSFGTYSAQDAAWRIYAENGNKWPDDVTIDLIGGAQTDESIGKGPFGKVGMGLIGLRNSEHDRAIPPGAKVRMFYNDRDPYASGGNESGLSLLYSIAGIGYGTHEVPDRNDPNVTWTMRKDANGVEHWIAHRKNEWVIDALERAGIKIMDTHSANEAIRALFPRNDDPNAPPPEADVRKALTLGARALDRQIDPSGNTKIFETVVENMPEPWKVLMNDGWNGINRAADAIARAAADPSPQNIQHAFNVTMSEIGKFMGGVQQIMGNQPEQSVKTWTVSSIGDIVKDTTRQYMGQEVDITPQLNQFADVMMATAKQWAAEAAANAEKNQTLGQQGDPLTIATQAIDQIPQNNPLITLNTAPDASATVTVPELPQQGQAPAVELTLPESSRVGLLPEVKLPEVPAVVAGPAPAPSASSAEITPPSPPAIADVQVPVVETPQWNPPTPEPEPVWNPPVMPEPVYQAPEPVWNPPAPAPTPPPVFEAPAPPPPPPPPPPIQLPSFQMPAFDFGNIFGGSAPAPSGPAFVPSSPTSIPSLNDGMILEPVG
jgi:hypothetical protein